MALQLPACLGAAFPPLTLKAHREPLTMAGLQLPACLGAAFPPLTLKAHREPLTTHYKSQHSRLRPSLLFPPQTGSASILSPHGRIEFKKAPKCPPDPPRPQLYVTVLQRGPRAGAAGRPHITRRRRWEPGTLEATAGRGSPVRARPSQWGRERG